MGLREYFAMHRYWSGHPPVQMMVAAYFGIKPETASSPQDNDQAMAELIAMFGVTPGATKPIG